MKRALEFDGIRSVAILFIVLCHICFGMGWAATGRFCANTFNTVFFLLSALLLGLNVNKYKLGGGKQFILQFLSKRALRLLCSLWPLLIVFAVVFSLTDIDFSQVSFAANMLMLGWFAKLPGLGHLWFVTMIMACYVTFAIIGSTPKLFKKPAIWVVFCLPLHIIVTTMGLPGYFFLILLYCSLAFLYAQDMVNWLNAVPIWMIAAAAMLVNVISYLLIYNKIIDNGIFANYVTTIGGLTIFALMYRIFKVYSPGKLLCGISSISYELYLIHHPFCLGEISFFNLFPALNDWAIVILIITVSTISAFILKRLSDTIYNALSVKSFSQKNRKWIK